MQKKYQNGVVTESVRVIRMMTNKLVTAGGRRGGRTGAYNHPAAVPAALSVVMPHEVCPAYICSLSRDFLHGSSSRLYDLQSSLMTCLTPTPHLFLGVPVGHFPSAATATT